MKKFWKITLIPGLCCILAGAVLAMVLALGFSDELMLYKDEFSINEDNFFEFIGGDKFISVTREGIRYEKSDTEESYYFAVPEGEAITGLDFEFAVGEVDVKAGDTLEITVVDMFENAISAKIVDGICILKTV